MSLMNNLTGHVWGQFAPRMKGNKNRTSNDCISMQLYPNSYFQTFDPHAEFDKWAAVEVKELEDIPEGMKAFTLQAGLYAVFDHKGSSEDNSIFQYIYSHWIPKSDFELDDRPHFELLGEHYKNNDPDSKEEIWIPIRPKSSTP